MEFDFPNIKEAVNDTFKIKDVFDWSSSFKPRYDKTEIRRIIGFKDSGDEQNGRETLQLLKLISSQMVRYF